METLTRVLAGLGDIAAIVAAIAVIYQDRKD